MKFKLEHRFDAPLEDVEKAMFHPDLGEFLVQHMTQLDGFEPQEREEDERTIRRRTLYKPKPLIRSVGPKQVPPAWMYFTEVSTYDKSAHRVEYDNVPFTGPATTRLKNHGTVRLVSEGSGTLRITEGELVVKVFLLGKIAEQVIYSQAKKLLEEEAAVLARFIREQA